MYPDIKFYLCVCLLSFFLFCFFVCLLVVVVVVFCLGILSNREGKMGATLFTRDRPSF